MEYNLNKSPDETSDQYFYRICKMKDTLGFTWPQIAEIMNDECGKDCGESAYRKEWNAFERIFNANADKLIGDGKYLEEIDSARRELEKERQKLYATKIEANRNLRQESRAELFYENIRDSISTLPLPNMILHDYEQNNANNKEYVLCIADIQGGAKFKIEMNEYSLAICLDRFQKLLDDVATYVLRNKITKLKIVELGDSIQNLIHITDLKLNETSVVEATIMIARFISCFLNELSSCCIIDYYHVPTSNHTQTRQLGTKANELVAEDLEYVIGHYINDMLHDNNRVTVHLNDGHDYIDIPIFNFNVMAMHGHTIKNLETALRDLSMTYRKLIDYVFIGHFHNGKVIPGNEHESHDTELLMCPSFQGTDPYAFNKLGKSSKAACKMFIFDEKYGCTGTEKFILN